MLSPKICAAVVFMLCNFEAVHKEQLFYQLLGMCNSSIKNIFQSIVSVLHSSLPYLPALFRYFIECLGGFRSRWLLANNLVG